MRKSGDMGGVETGQGKGFGRKIPLGDKLGLGSTDGLQPHGTDIVDVSHDIAGGIKGNEISALQALAVGQVGEGRPTGRTGWRPAFGAIPKVGAGCGWMKKLPPML